MADADVAHGDEDEILGAAEVSELLGMNVQMVRKYAREGRIPAYRLPGGRNYKFFRRELLDYVREHRVNSLAEAARGD